MDFLLNRLEELTLIFRLVITIIKRFKFVSQTSHKKITKTENSVQIRALFSFIHLMLIKLLALGE